LIGNEKVRIEMGCAARTFAESLSWEDSAEKMETYLKARVAEHHPLA